MNHAEMVLIVEDEDKIASVLTDYLGASGLHTHRLSHGGYVLDWVRRNRPLAVLLDRKLPGRDGLEICRDLRASSNVPIMMITARSEEADRLEGFQVGVDDYICKPFSPREVTARVQALLRRSRGGTAEVATAGILLNEETYRVGANGREVQLTAVEFKMLQVLVRATGRIFSRQEIMDRIYADFRVVNDRTIDSHIKKLRRKIDQLGLEREPVHSVYGVGYKFDP